MDAKKYLEMSVEELNQQLIADVMANVSEVPAMVEELKLSKRYSEDPLFCAFIDSAKILASFVSGDYSEVIPICEELVHRTTAFRLWNLVSLHWNLLGGVYLMFGLHEKAMEYYYRVVSNEKAHGLNGFISLAYNNIAFIYLNNIRMELPDRDALEKCCTHLEWAILTLKEGGKEQPRYHPKLLICLSTLLPCLVALKKSDRMKEVLEEIREIDFSKVSSEAFYAYYRAMMFYYIEMRELKKTHEFFLKARECISENDEIKTMILIKDYVCRCRLSGLEFSFFEKDLLELEDLQQRNPDQADMQTIVELSEYYTLIGNIENKRKMHFRYIDLLEEFFENIRLSRVYGLSTMDELLRNRDHMSEPSSKHSELEAVAEEAIRHKNESQKAYRRIQMIHELGQKLTSSMKIKSVVDLIHENLGENLPLTSFILMVSDEKKRELRSLAYYEGERELPAIRFKWEDPNSLFAECFRSKRRIVIDDFIEDSRFFYRKLLMIGKESVRSGVFLPLVVEGEVIGAFSVQDRKAASYGEEELKFLDLLTPHLSIALNNAIYSDRLENEIHDRVRAQEALKKANRKLEYLSSLDGLTQIANRREFERRLLELLDEARTNDHSVSILMFDIDNFKKYNDTYGHLQGDEVLKRVAATILENLDQVGGISARFGGEEFIAACSNLSEEESRQLAEKICADVRDLKIENSATALGILTLSIGVAVAEGKALENKSLLMRSADEALYEAKNSGKNRAEIRGFRETR